MKHYSVTRVVAITTLTCLLTVFALPSAAAPFGGVTAEGIWSPASLLHWVQTVWTGWFGSGGEASGSSGITNIHDEARAVTEPDGVAATAPTDDSSPVDGGTDSATP